MLDAATVAEIRRLYYAEHWKVGTIGSQLGVHADAVRRALRQEPSEKAPAVKRRCLTDPFVPLLAETLQRYPRLRATVLYRMLEERGYKGSVVQLRRVVRKLRPRPPKEAFLRVQCLPGEAAQVDWADFGRVSIGRARRPLSAFVMTLSYSRALYVEFFFGQSLVNFVRGHVRAFEHFGGVARHLLTDNLRSVVLERRGEQMRLHPRYLELAGHYCFQARPCHVARGNEKGRVERSIRYLRESFFAARHFTTLSALNEKVWAWCCSVAARRPWPDNPKLTVAEAFAHEQPRLLPLPQHRLDTTERVQVYSDKTLWVRFDRNDYSIPPGAVGNDLTVEASENEVRLLEGLTEIARHRRSYDQGERITDPAHTQALLDQKKAALGSATGSALRLAVPEVERFLDAAFARYRGTALLTTHLTRLRELYGAEALNKALAEAVERATPNLASVEFLLEMHRRAENRRPPLPVDLAQRPELAALHVQPHCLGDYDRLCEVRPEKEDCDE